MTSTDTGGSSTPGACPAKPTWSWAVLFAIDVTWPATSASVAGAGKIYEWSKVSFTAAGDQLTGIAQTCGDVLPDTMLNGLGTLAAGGSKVQVEVLHPIWDVPSMPKFPLMGTQKGAGMGGTINFAWTSVYGFKMDDATNAPWPASYKMVMNPMDVDADGKPGFTAVARTGGGYVAPPTAVGLGGSAPAAEKVHLVSRSVYTLDGTRSSCDEAAGKVTVKFFDNHVIGCDLKNGMPCNATQIDFLDQGQTIYVIKGATFKARMVPDNASCEDVRKTLPM